MHLPNKAKAYSSVLVKCSMILKDIFKIFLSLPECSIYYSRKSTIPLLKISSANLEDELEET
jgi:hypothetical protein